MYMAHREDKLDKEFFYEFADLTSPRLAKLAMEMKTKRTLYPKIKKR